MATIRPLVFAALLTILAGSASAQPLVLPSPAALSRLSASSTNAPLDRVAQSDRANDLVWQAEDIVNSQRSGFSFGFKHSHLRSGSREYFYADGYRWIRVRRSSNGPIGPSLLRQGARGTQTSQSAGRTLILQAVGHVAIGRSDGEGSSELLGGPRLVVVSSPRVGVFGEMLVGVLHFPGENFLTLQPGGGVYVPLQGRRFLLNARVGLNTASFGPFRETGIVVGGGLTVPFGVR